MYGVIANSKKRLEIHERPKWNQNQPKKKVVESKPSVYSHCGACRLGRRRKQKVCEILQEAANRDARVSKCNLVRASKKNTRTTLPVVVTDCNQTAQPKTQMEFVRENEKALSPKYPIFPEFDSGRSSSSNCRSSPPIVEEQTDESNFHRRTPIRVKCASSLPQHGTSSCTSTAPETPSIESYDSDRLSLKNYFDTACNGYFSPPKQSSFTKPIILHGKVCCDSNGFLLDSNSCFNPIRPPMDVPQRPATVTNPIYIPTVPTDCHIFPRNLTRRGSLDEQLSETFRRRFKPYETPSRKSTASRVTPMTNEGENSFVSYLKSMSPTTREISDTFPRHAEGSASRLSHVDSIPDERNGTFNDGKLACLPQRPSDPSLSIDKRHSHLNDSAINLIVSDLQTVVEEDENMESEADTKDECRTHSSADDVKPACLSRTSLRDAIRNLAKGKSNPIGSQVSKTTTEQTKTSISSDSTTKNSDKGTKTMKIKSPKTKSLFLPASAVSFNSTPGLSTDKKSPPDKESKQFQSQKEVAATKNQAAKEEDRKDGKWKFSPMSLIYGNKEKKQKAVLKKNKKVKRRPKTRKPPVDTRASSTPSSSNDSKNCTTQTETKKPVRKTKSRKQTQSEGNSQVKSTSRQKISHFQQNVCVEPKQINTAVNEAPGGKTRSVFASPRVPERPTPPLSALLKTHSKPEEIAMPRKKQPNDVCVTDTKFGRILGPAAPWTNIFDNADDKWSKASASRYAFPGQLGYPNPTLHSCIPRYHDGTGYMSDTPRPLPYEFNTCEYYFPNHRPLTMMQMRFACRPREETYMNRCRSPKASQQRVVRFNSNPAIINGKSNTEQYQAAVSTNYNREKPFERPPWRSRTKYISVDNNRLRHDSAIRFSLRDERMKPHGQPYDYSSFALLASTFEEIAIVLN